MTHLYGPNKQPQNPYQGTPNQPPPKQSRTARVVSLSIAGGIGLLVLMSILDSLADNEKDAKPAAGSAVASQEVETSAAGPADDVDAGVLEVAALPDLTGQTLQAAQDAAQAAGFFILTSSDATGAGRMQVLDRNWQVCSQTPAAGSASTDTAVDFSTVKLEEFCP